jgi:hypothetical protein
MILYVINLAQVGLSHIKIFIKMEKDSKLLLRGTKLHKSLV